jgi:hypothetical protein
MQHRREREHRNPAGPERRVDAQGAESKSKTRRLPLALIVTALSLAIAMGSLALSKRADDRSAATEQELGQVNVEVVGATLPVFGQFVAKPEIRAAVSVAISNASLRGVIVRDARIELDGRRVGCVVGWVNQDELPKVKLAASAPPRIEEPLPLALASRAVRNIAFLFVVKPKGLYPQCVDNPQFRRLAKDDLRSLSAQAAQRRLRLVLELVPHQRVSVRIDVVLCVPRFRPDPSRVRAGESLPADAICA